MPLASETEDESQVIYIREIDTKKKQKKQKKRESSQSITTPTYAGISCPSNDKIAKISK
jgi:hypothetical protein